MNKEVIKGLIPWLIFFLLSDPGFVHIGIGASLVSILLFVVPHLRKRLLLDWSSMLFFTFLALVVIAGGQYWVHRYGVLFANTAIAVIAVCSLLMGKPFTWQYAQAYDTKGYTYSPTYITMHRNISAIWAIIFIMDGLLHAVYLDHVGDYLWTNEIMPIVALLLGVLTTLLYPLLLKRRIKVGGISGLKLISELHHAAIDKGMVAYRTLGQGTPVLLLPDYHMTVHQWDPELVYELSHDHKLYLLEYPGIGQTNFDNPATIEGVTDYVRRFITTVVAQPVSIVGYGMGGWVAQKLALEHDQYLQRLVLIATDFGGEQAYHGSHNVLSTVMTDPHFTNEYLELMSYVMFTDAPKNFERDKLYAIYESAGLEPQLSHEVLYQQKAIIKQWYNTGIKTKLANIEKSTLLLAADQDQLVPVDNSIVMSEHIPNSQLIRFEKGGHGMIYQEPFEIASYIKGFLATLSET
jgi:pimeloyl-ACP methyl ester carboxylesterase